MKSGAIVALTVAATFIAGCASQAAKPCCQGQAAEKPTLDRSGCKGKVSCKQLKRVHRHVQHAVKQK